MTAITRTRENVEGESHLGLSVPDLGARVVEIKGVPATLDLSLRRPRE